MPRKFVRRRRAVRKTKAPKRRVMRKGMRKGGVSDYATASVRTTITPVGGGNFASNIMYSTYQNNGIKLSDFPRAVNIAKNYQHYKIKQIKITLKFSYDTFVQGNAAPGAGSRPNLYYIIDKSASLTQGTTLEALKQMGARPHACDNRQFTITWRPGVLVGERTMIGTPYTSYKLSPWLATNPGGDGGLGFIPSSVEHNGLYWYVEQLFGGGVQFNAEMEVQFAFKKPLYVTAAGAPAPIGIAPAVLDNSSDGIVGGPDSNNVLP